MTAINRAEDIIGLIKDIDKRLRRQERRSKYDDENDDAPLPPSVTKSFSVREAKTHLEFRGIVKWGTVSPNTCQADVDYWVVEAKPVTSGGADVDPSGESGGANDTSFIRHREVNNKNQDNPHAIFDHLERPKTWYWVFRVRIVDKAHRKGPWSAWTTPTLPWTGADPKPPAPTYSDPAGITFDNVNKDRHTKHRLLFTFNEVNWDVPGGDHEDDVDGYVVQMRRSDDGITWDGRDTYRHHYVPARRADGTDGDDTPTTRTTHFVGVRRRYWYSVRVRTKDRFNRLGDWSAWSTGQMPFDDNQPPQPVSVRIFNTATDRVVLDWDDPTVDIQVRGTVSGTSGTPTVNGTNTKFGVEVEAGDRVKISGNTYTVKKVTNATTLTLTGNLSTSPSSAKMYIIEDDPDVHHYIVQIAMASGVTTGSPDDYNTIYARDRTRGNRKAFKIPDADRGNTFYGRVQSIDAAYNRSKHIDGTTAGNSNPNVGGTGVVIGAGSGKTKIPTTFFGRMRIVNENRSPEYDMDEGLTTLKVRGRLKQAPAGSSLIFSIYKNNVSIGSVTIAAGSKRGVNDSLTTTWADADILSYSVDQVGSSFPGRHLVITHVLQ